MKKKRKIKMTWTEIVLMLNTIALILISIEHLSIIGNLKKYNIEKNYLHQLIEKHKIHIMDIINDLEEIKKERK